jgi:hypothetical protein
MALSIVFAIVFGPSIACPDSSTAYLKLSFIGLIVGFINYSLPETNCKLIKYTNFLKLQIYFHSDIVQPINGSLSTSSIEGYPHLRFYFRPQCHHLESPLNYL